MLNDPVQPLLVLVGIADEQIACRGGEILLSIMSACPSGDFVVNLSARHVLPAGQVQGGTPHFELSSRKVAVYPVNGFLGGGSTDPDEAGSLPEGEVELECAHRSRRQGDDVYSRSAPAQEVLSARPGGGDETVYDPVEMRG